MNFSLNSWLNRVEQVDIAFESHMNVRSQQQVDCFFYNMILSQGKSNGFTSIQNI